jgi:hypothetical protein
VTIVDTNPPVVNCPTNFTVPYGTSWTFTQPTGLDSCCGTNVTVTVLATSTNYNGANCTMVHSRTWRIKDCCNNSVICAQTVTVQYGPPPNDDCINAQMLAVNAPYLCGYTICATPSPAGSLVPPPCGASVASPDVWYIIVPVCTGPITVDTCAPCPGQPTFDTVLSAYTGYNANCPGPLTQIAGACNNDYPGCGLRSAITFNVIAGQLYLVRVAGAANAIGWFSIRAQQTNPTPANDLIQNAASLTPGVPACGSTICATPSAFGMLIPAPCGNSVNTPDVWYQYTPQCSEQVTLNTCGSLCLPCPLCVGYTFSPYNTVLSVYTGNPAGPLNQVANACNDNALVGPCAGSPQSQLTFPAIGGVTYYIRVSGAGPGTVGVFTLNLSTTPNPPPGNDLCANAIPITPGTYPWNNCNATTDGPVNNPGAACDIYQDIWFKYTPQCSGPVFAYNCVPYPAPVGPGGLVVYTGPCTNLSLVNCGSWNTTPLCPNGVTTSLSFNALAGTTYYLRVGTMVPGYFLSGTLTVLGPYPPQPTCGPAGPCAWRYFRITGLPNCIKWGWALRAPCCMSLQNTNVAAVCGGNENTLAAAFVSSINATAAAAGCTNVFAQQIVAPQPGRFGICTPCNFALSVGAAGVPPELMCVVPNPGGFPAIQVGWCSFNPDIEEIRLSGHDLNNNGIDDAVDIDDGTSQDVNGNGIPDEVETCLPPMLIAEPPSQVVQPGSSVALSVSTLDSVAPLSYAWTRDGFPVSDGPNISGATTANLNITAVTAAETGSYSVTVSNACGSAVTTPATLSLTTPTLPVLYDVSQADGWFQFSVETRFGFDYVVQYTEALDHPVWSTLNVIAGAGQPQLVLDSDPLPQARFYRVIEQPHH